MCQNYPEELFLIKSGCSGEKPSVVAPGCSGWFQSRPSVVACTCNPANLEAEFWNGVGPIPVGSFDRWVDCVTTCNPPLGEELD